MPKGPVVQVESVTHRYGERVALDDVSFSVEAHQLVALLGPNGGGKTTLFKILTTLMRPTQGAARVGGADVVRQRDEVRRRIGIVFQKPSLDDRLTVHENLMHQGHMYGLSGAALKRKSLELLERFDIADRQRDRIAALSGGLQQRVELVKALLHDPKVLILDEPGTGMDPGARRTMMGYLSELKAHAGVTVLLTTHLMDEADRCDHVAILDRGRIIQQGAPANLKQTIGGDVLIVGTQNQAVLAQKVNAKFGVAAEVIDDVVRMERERGHEFVPMLIEAFPGEVDSITVGKPTLEDVFVHYTGHRLDDSPPTAEATARRGHRT